VQSSMSKAQRRKHLIDYLFDVGITKLVNGRQLHEANLVELERLHITYKCKVGNEIAKIVQEEKAIQ
jgi:hypothetical protein